MNLKRQRDTQIIIWPKFVRKKRTVEKKKKFHEQRNTATAWLGGKMCGVRERGKESDFKIHFWFNYHFNPYLLFHV